MRALASLLLALTAVVATPGPATAECVGTCPVFAPGADERPTYAIAFTARVVDISDAVDPPPPDASPYERHIELDVVHVYRGNVPGRITWNEWIHQCYALCGQRLTEGDIVFVAAGPLRDVRHGRDPFTGDVTVWRRADGQWGFFGRGTEAGPDRAYYGPTIRSADTLSEIRAIVESAALPDTSMAGAKAMAPARRGSGSQGVWILAGLVGFAIGLRRLRAVATPNPGRVDRSRG